MKAPQMWLQTPCVYALWPLALGLLTCNNNNNNNNDGCYPNVSAEHSGVAASKVFSNAGPNAESACLCTSLQLMTAPQIPRPLADVFGSSSEERAEHGSSEVPFRGCESEWWSEFGPLRDRIEHLQGQSHRESLYMLHWRCCQSDPGRYGICGAGARRTVADRFLLSKGLLVNTLLYLVHRKSFVLMARKCMGLQCSTIVGIQ